ncbi:MAG: site-specific integrase [Flavobacteriales bacterium]|nr:site-specific integrase [Flavobacteriales bacterium]
MPTQTSEKPRPARLSEPWEEINGTNKVRALEPLGPHVPRMHRCHAVAVMGYVPAVAHFTPALVYVDCYAIHPDTGRLKRKRYKLNRFKNRTQCKAMARDLVDKLNKQLLAGWSPWSKAEAPKATHSLQECLDAFLKEKQRTTTNRSPLVYASHVSRFLTWCKGRGLAHAPVGLFTRTEALKWMEHIRDERKVSRTTYNNYRQFANIMFNWMVEHQYLAVNPFAGIKKMRQEQKLRTLITAKERDECLAWFREHDPAMVLVCLMTFNCLLRPRSELLRIRVRDVDVDAAIINVSGDKTKSKRVRRPAIPDSVLPEIREALRGAAPNEFVVGRSVFPNATKCAYNTLGLRWNKMRDSLGWGKEKQLYSLRDSGIVQLLADGVDLTHVMRQADHSEIGTTNRYVQHYFPGGLEQVRRKATAFGTSRTID